MPTSFRQVSWMIILLSVSLPASAEPTEEFQALSEEQRVALRDGEQVLVVRDRSGSFYPDIWVFQVVEGTPEEAMSIFADFGIRKDYQPHVIGMEVLEGLGQAKTRVAWDLDLPTVGKKQAVYHQELSSTDCKFQMRAEAQKPPVGYKTEVSTMTLESVVLKGEDGRDRTVTLATYATVVNGAWWMPVVHSRGSHFKSYQTMIAAFVNYVAKQRAEKPKLLVAQLGELRKMIPQSCPSKIAAN